MTAPSTEVKPPLENRRVGKLDRRGFLGVAFAASLAALAGGWMGALLKFLRPPETQGFGGLVYAGRVDEFPPGSVTRVLAGRFYISHTPDGLLAIYQKCTHLGCSVPWSEAEGQFHCPCHGSLFTKVGEVSGGPAPRPMDTFPLQIENGEVWVDTGHPISRSSYSSDQAQKV